ncbi:hypothetical protein ACFOEK_07400 [Litoribrevibacter euphylliae]|uniref:Cytochrome c domain-containing protein n=1 Tax=Litoribrevibacter euphylliae TaxID=1834034 RepID=A0ABV7HE63_9GAMM
MTWKPLHLGLVFTSLFGLWGCDSRDDTEVDAATVDSTMTPDRFLSFINDQAQLGIGDYQVVVSPENDGDTGSYQLTVTLPDGSSQNFSGSWPVVSGAAATTAASPENNPSHDISLSQSGALSFSLSSSVAGHLYLMKNGSLIADEAGTSPSLSWTLDASEIDSQAYAEAYYELVDPNNERTTLADWKTVNGFDQGGVTHVVFRDTKDLGYGRDMYVRETEAGGLAFYVDNYVVIFQEGSSSNYGPLNLDAALAQDRNRHIGTNAIEFSRLDPDDPTSPRVLKFFTFSPEESTGEQARLLKANLDGRGIKYMPTMCLVCHGGTMLPLNDDGTFPVQSVLSAKYNRLELDSFEYGEEQGQTRLDQEANLKQLNQWILNSYQEINARNQDTRGKWWGDYAIEMMEGHYGGAGLPNDTYDVEVPSGWQASDTRPEGVEVLFTDVIEPHCVSCHSLRGTEAGNRETTTVNGEVISLANAISFSSYEQFISYNDKIIEYVFRRGVMPLSLRNYEKFWDDPDGAPSTLASFLTGFDVFNEDREVEEPGQPYARPGEDRQARSPVQLTAVESLFSDQYAWQVMDAPAGAEYSFSATSSVTSTTSSSISPVFITDTDGDYEIQLTVSNGSGESDSASFVLTIDSQGIDQTSLNFVDDVRPILGSDTLARCSNCHNQATGRQGIPVYYDDSNPNQYHDVLARVNLAYPQDSLLLLKPTQLQHGGGIQINRNTVSGEAEYQTLLNWIREGAVCGDDENICPN